MTTPRGSPPVVVRREPSGEPHFEPGETLLSVFGPTDTIRELTLDQAGKPPYCSSFVGTPKCIETPEQRTKAIGDDSPIGRRKPRHRFPVRVWGEAEGAGAHVESVDDDELPHGGCPDPSEHLDGFGGHH